MCRTLHSSQGPKRRITYYCSVQYIYHPHCDASRKNFKIYLDINRFHPNFASKNPTIMLKRTIDLFFCYMILVTFSCSKSGQPANTFAGQLIIENARQSFGKINKKELETIKLYFPLRNYGEKPIVINRVDASCGCITTELSSKTIMPNKSQTLIVTIDTKYKKGVFNKSLFVRSTAINNLEIIRIKGEIQE